jgi:hypothetical protein
MKLKKQKRQSGQVLIETIIVMAVILTLLFVLVQIAWAMAYGHYTQYATYMAARSYLAAAGDTLKQKDNATRTLNRLLKSPSGGDILSFVAKARTGGDRDIAGDEPTPGAFIGTTPTAASGPGIRLMTWMEGVQYNYLVPLYIAPLAGNLRQDIGKSLEVGTGSYKTSGGTWQGGIPLTSDAWLGREVSISDCWADMDRLAASYPRQDGRQFIEDNGC